MLGGEHEGDSAEVRFVWKTKGLRCGRRACRQVVGVE